MGKKLLIEVIILGNEIVTPMLDNVDWGRFRKGKRFIADISARSHQPSSGLSGYKYNTFVLKCP